MLYQSTRGKSVGVSFEEAIIKGIADDGGLFVPERIPRVSLEFISSLATKSYAETSFEILKLYMEGFPADEIRDCATAAYNGVTFDDPEVVPVRKISDDLFVMELFHGPTSAFKDIALQLLPNVLTRCMKKTGISESVAILVATSGDTGKAALEGFKDVPGTSILVFYPRDGVSEIQMRQMVTQEGGNVAVAAVEGNFDDAQTGVKAIFADREAGEHLRKLGLRLSSANSINWGRLMPQIAYYFWAYATLVKNGEIKIGEKLRFAVPTGNFGNILAGWYAREMGLPVSRFICASNDNKVLTDFINTGVYDLDRKFMTTMSPAMDILISSNLERLLYELSGRDAERVAGWMGELAKNRRYDAGPVLHEKITELFYGGFATEAETSKALGDTFGRFGYLTDTHTAVGIHVYNNYISDAKNTEELKLKTIVAATASPYKFAKDVYEAVKHCDIGAAGYVGKADIRNLTEAPRHTDDAVTPRHTDDAEDSRHAAPRHEAPLHTDGNEFAYIDLLHKISGVPVPAALRDLHGKTRLHFATSSREDMKATALRLLSELNKK